MNNPPDRTIEIIIFPAGQTRITTRGYTGTACKDATRELERALGIIQSDSPTTEMYQNDPIVQNQNEGR